MSVLHTDGRTDMWIKSSIRRMVWNGQEMVGESVTNLILEFAFLFSLQNSYLQGNIFMNLQTYGNRVWSGPLDAWLNELVNSTKN